MKAPNMVKTPWQPGPPNLVLVIGMAVQAKGWGYFDVYYNLHLARNWRNRCKVWLMCRLMPFKVVRWDNVPVKGPHPGQPLAEPTLTMTDGPDGSAGGGQ